MKETLMRQIIAKQGMPEYCYNCRYSDFTYNVYDQGGGISYAEYKCTLTKKRYSWEYSSKKWEEME